jgi:hypothetical protein
MLLMGACSAISLSIEQHFTTCAELSSAVAVEHTPETYLKAEQNTRPSRQPFTLHIRISMFATVQRKANNTFHLIPAAQWFV